MEIFLTALLRASVYGSIVICVILLLRLALRKAPKKYICLLWLLAALRLLMPFEIESSISLQPEWNPAIHAQTGSADIQQSGPQNPTPVLPQESQPSQNGEAVEPDIGFQPDVDLQPGKDPQPDTPLVDAEIETPSLSVEQIVCGLWLAGACGMLLYSGVSYWLLRRRVRDAVVLSEGVWVSGKLDTAFVLGYFRPGIYLNATLDAQQRSLVLRHEACHIRRGDHWWKLLGYATLAVHWFNPLVWVGYICLCRDLEMACDEAVVRNMDVAERKAYSAALLGCGVHHRGIAACPVAFGEVSVKARIKNVLHYRKPSFWIVLAVVAAILAVSIFLLTSPAGKEPLEICREAYLKLQTYDGCVIRVHTPDCGDPGMWPAHETVETWANGDNWYSCYTSGNYVEEHLQYEGRLFIRQTAPQEREDLPYREWTELTAEEAKDWGVINRLKSTIWEEHAFACQENTENGKYVLLVDDKYTWTLTIEEATNAITSAHSSFYNGEYEHTADVEITYPEKETVSKKIEQCFQDATNSKKEEHTLSTNDRQILKICELALEMQHTWVRSHILINTTMEGIPTQNGSTMEFWKWCDSWLMTRSVDMAAIASVQDYTVGNLLLDGVQYRFGHATNRPADKVWTVAEEHQQIMEPWILRNALLTENVVKVITNYTADTIEITLYFNGPPREMEDGDWYGCVQTWYLDPSWNLQRVTEIVTMRYVEDGVTYYPKVTQDIQIMPSTTEEVTAILEAAKAEVLEDVQ